jgi:hypothetical protein
VRKIEGISKYMIVERGDRKLWWQYRIIALLPFKGVGDMRYLQFAVVAGKKWASGDGMSR